jgi:hypothetical protein
MVPPPRRPLPNRKSDPAFQPDRDADQRSVDSDTEQDHERRQSATGRIGDAAVCASASRCPSRSSAQKRAPRPDDCRAHPVAASTAESSVPHNHLHRRASAILGHNAGRPLAGVVARGRGSGKKNCMRTIRWKELRLGLSRPARVRPAHFARVREEKPARQRRSTRVSSTAPVPIRRLTPVARPGPTCKARPAR